MTPRVWQPGAENYLRRYGVTSADDIKKVLSGFNFDRPVYEQPIARGEIYFQFVRTPALHDESPALGDWFCLRGQDLRRLAIYSPGGARRVGEFEVIEDAIVLEGIAKSFRVSPQMAGKYPQLARLGIGGRGGGTQIYVPRALRAALRLRGMYLDSGPFAGP
jgi:hypothetical protein